MKTLGMNDVWELLTAGSVQLEDAGHDVRQVLIHGGDYEAEDIYKIASWLSGFDPRRHLSLYCCSRWGGTHTKRYNDRYASEGQELISKILSHLPWGKVPPKRDFRVLMAFSGRASNTPEEVLEAIRFFPEKRIAVVSVDAHTLRVRCTWKEIAPHHQPVFIRPGRQYLPEFDQRIISEARAIVRYTPPTDKGIRPIAEPDSNTMEKLRKFVIQQKQ